MKRWLFDQIHRRNLIYNQCWEDPSVDHEALNLGPRDRIVMITSAGCNALDYLLRMPQSIDCVDVNPHQTALLELKIVALQRLQYRDFFSMFGIGRVRNHRELYRRELMPFLTPASRSIWDRRIDYFDPKGHGIYFSGTAGYFARLLKRYIDLRPNLRNDLEHFQRIQSLEEQAAFYRLAIAPKLWSQPLRWLLRRGAVMSMLGVPIEQIHQMQSSSRAALGSLIEERVDRMFTKVPVRDNYFWRVYMNGHYTPDCCPNYLKSENFEALKILTIRIRLHTTTVADLLRSERGQFTVFVLLDHMDWLTSSPEALREEWNLILRRAGKNARIIYRSGGVTFDHLPDFARERLAFDPALTTSLSEKDRVGTYGSFHLARVTP